MVTVSGREWWATSSTTHTSWRWTGVDEFAAYVDDGGYQIAGLFGAVGSRGAVANGDPGDIIHLYRTSDGQWYHSMFIVDVTGTSGYRTNADYYVCAHTSNRRNETMESILGSSYTDYRLVTISGSYV